MIIDTSLSHRLIRSTVPIINIIKASHWPMLARQIILFFIRLLLVQKRLGLPYQDRQPLQDDLALP